MTKNKRSQKKNKYFNTILICYQQIMFAVMMSKGLDAHNTIGALCSTEVELFHTIAYVL